MNMLTQKYLPNILDMIRLYIIGISFTYLVCNLGLLEYIGQNHLEDGQATFKSYYILQLTIVKYSIIIGLVAATLTKIIQLMIKTN